MSEPADDMACLLMAVADGEANQDERRRVMEALRRDPSLARQMKEFEDTGRSLGQLFDGVLAQPVPERLVRTVQTTSMGSRATAGTGPTAGAVTQGWLDRFGDWFGVWPIPATALAALAIGFGAGAWLMPDGLSGKQAGAPMVASGAVAEALAIATTGAERVLETRKGPVTFKLVQTFLDGGGTACREFEAQQDSTSRQYGIACRRSGGWQLRAVFRGEAHASGVTTTAGAGLGDALDGLAERMKSGDALGVEAEGNLIASGWPDRH